MSQAITWGVPRSSAEADPPGSDVPMTQYATRDDQALDALLSGHAGDEAPAYAVLGTRWIDTSGAPLLIEKFFDGTNWIVVRFFHVNDDYTRSTDCFLGTSGGTATAVTLTTVFGLTAYRDGMRFIFKMGSNGTGALTLNVDAIGAKSVKLPNGSNPGAAQLPTDSLVEVVYNAALDTMVMLGGGVPAITTFARSLLDDTTAGAFLTTLGVSSFVQTILDDADGPAVLATIGAMPIAGGTFTGDAVLANGTPGSQFSAGFRALPVTAANADRTLARADIGRLIRHAGGTPHAWTIPPTSTGSWNLGDGFLVANIGSGALTVQRGSGVTLRKWGSATSLDLTLAAHAMATLICLNTDIWYASGIGI
ncbi:MAG: hypothetical protein KIS96_11710 [Bauldia sp.]|nr:hypothetical protein [Bauldia sp.]